jgi:hypothetical protein
MEQIVVLLVDPSQNLVSTLLLIVKLKTLAPSLVIFDVPTHLIFNPTWEKLVLLDQI